MVDVEKLISSVKNHPMLYDLNNGEYKNTRMKDKVWSAIGLELGESGDTLKKKWKNLRDCYAKFIRAEKTITGQDASSNRYYKSWPWAKQMEIFKPFLKFAQITESTSILPFPESEELQQQNDTIEIEQTVPSRKRKRETKSSVDKADISTYLQGRKTSEVHTSNLNATEHMFLGFAKTIATFSVRRQASVKMRIANIVLEEELFQREEEEYALQSTSTFLSGSTEHQNSGSPYTSTSNEGLASENLPSTAQFYESYKKEV